MPSLCRHKHSEGLRKNVRTLEARVADAEQRFIEYDTNQKHAYEEIQRYKLKLQKVAHSLKSAQDDAKEQQTESEKRGAQIIELEGQMTCKQRACEEAVQQLDGMQHENLGLQANLREQIRVWFPTLEYFASNTS